MGPCTSLRFSLSLFCTVPFLALNGLLGEMALPAGSWEGDASVGAGASSRGASSSPVIQQKPELGSWRVGLNGDAGVPEIWARSPALPTAVGLISLKSVDFKLCVLSGDVSPFLPSSVSPGLCPACLTPHRSSALSSTPQAV